MANEKILNTRIGLKVDTLENWNKSTLALKKGEVAFATVAATAGNGLTEPVVMMKIGEDGVKTFSQIEWNFYAKASDVLESAKSETALTNFINNVIANSDLNGLSGRVTTLEDLVGSKSVAIQISEAIAALDLSNTYVAKENGKSLVDDDEITKLAGIFEGATKVEASATNGNIKINGTDTVVYTHPDKHAIADVDGLQDALDGKQAVGDYATKTEAQAYADAKDEAIAAAKKAGEDAQSDVDALDDRVKAIEDDYLVEADKTELTGLITAEKERAEAAEAKALTDAKAYTDEVKAGILGEGITETYDTLKEIENWIKGEGVDATELTSAIAGEAALREEADTAMDTRIKALEAIDHEHANKDLLDTYKQTEEDLADAVSKKHSHNFSDESALNGITADKVSAWDAAEGNAKTYADGKVQELAEGAVATNTGAIATINETLDTYGDIVTRNAEEFATAIQGAKADTAIQTVTTTVGNGIKATTTGTDVTIDWDSEVTLVFDCGTSGGWL